MTQFLYIPFGGGGGGGSSQDRFAPKYLVGNVANGDTAVEYAAGGFFYYADPGTALGAGLRLAAALQAAAVKKGDVWIRPGTYLISSTLTVPAGVTVRGAGPGVTFIRSVNGTISGPLFDLGSGAELRDMNVKHNQPIANNVPLEGYGVVQVKDGSARCENVVASSDWTTPTNSTLRACFLAFSTDSNTLKASLECSNCTAQFRSNTGGGYATNLVGFRAADADLKLVECNSAVLGSILDPIIPDGYNVIAIASGQSAPINVTIRGGTYEAIYGCIYVEGNNPAANKLLCSDVTALGGKNPAGGGSVGIGAARQFVAGIHNCDVLMELGNGPPCVGFYPQAGNENFNTGRVVGCRMSGGANSYPWYSQSFAGVSGYHTFLANTYQTTMLAPVTGANDEEAHNIATL